MARKISKIYTDNPSSSMRSNDLLYLGISPYGLLNDSAILFSNFQRSIDDIGAANDVNIGKNLKLYDTFGILDGNGNKQLIFNTAANAVNYLEVTNAASASGPLLQAVGSDTDVELTIQSKGDGDINITPDGDGKMVVTNNATINTLNFGTGLAEVSTGIMIGIAGSSGATGVSNVFISPATSGQALTTANSCIAIGSASLRDLTSGNNNIGVGTGALASATTGAGCVMIGQNAGSSSNGFDNIGLGLSALFSLTTGRNIGIGRDTGRGFQSGQVSLTTGVDNILIGYSAGVDAADADGCVVIGRNGVGEAATGTGSGDHGPGIAIGSSTAPVGFRGDDTIYPTAGSSAGYWRVKINDTVYKIELFADS